MKRKVIKPNVVSGGVAIPLGDNIYLMRGRKHKNGGIDIGNDPKTGIEVEDGEVMQMTNKGAKIFSAMPLLRGSSPANEVLSGANPNDVFRRQEAYKDRNGINDDGSKKKAIGGGIPPYNTKNKSNMYQRMKDPNRKTITDWKTGKTSTHKLAYATIDDKVVVYPNIQEINGKLYDFTDPKNNRGKWDSLRRAINTGDTIQFKNETDADKFVNNYKKEFKEFDKYAGGGIAYRNAYRTVFGDNVGIYPISVNDLFRYPAIPNDLSEEEKTKRREIRGKVIDNGYKFIRNDLSMAGIDSTKLKDTETYKPYEKNLNFRRNRYRARDIEENGYLTIPKITTNDVILSSDINRTIPYVNKNTIGHNPYGMKPDRFDNPEIISYITPEEAKTLRYNIDKGNTTNSSSKFSKFFKNKDNVSDLIGVGSNILGSTLSYFRNKSMLKNMQAPIKPTIAAPVSYQQTKLKTNVNINPQLDTLRNSSAIYNNSVDNNTASSRVALARKQANRMNINNQINNLYGNKENQETELINKDRMQQQQTANQNVAQYNDYLNRKAALDNEYNNQLINFKNTINEKKAENAVSLFSNANAAIQDILGRREQRTNERNTIAAYLASHPDVSPELYNRLLGENNPLFDDEIVNLWKDRYKKKLKPKTE